MLKSWRKSKQTYKTKTHEISDLWSDTPPDTGTVFGFRACLVKDCHEKHLLPLLLFGIFRSYNLALHPTSLLGFLTPMPIQNYRPRMSLRCTPTLTHLVVCFILFCFVSIPLCFHCLLGRFVRE